MNPFQSFQTPTAGTPLMPSTPSSGPAYLVTFEMQGFQGSGDAASAARQALAGQRGVEPSSIVVDEAGGTIQVQVAGAGVNTGPYKAALQQAGFQIGSTSLRPAGG
jgi:hypothetical protein